MAEGVCVFMLQGFRREGLHRSSGLMRGRPSTVPMDNFTEGFSGYINAKREGCRGKGMNTHSHADTGLFSEVLFYTHARHHTHHLHEKPQDVKEPSETLCEVPIDGH